MNPIENHLSVDFRAYLRLFAFYIYNCSFDTICFVHPMPEYHSTLETKGTFFGQIFAVFINNLEVTLDGNLISNSGGVHQAQKRVAQLVVRHFSLQQEFTHPLSSDELQIEGSKEEGKNEIKRFASDFGLGILEPAVLGSLDYVALSWNYESIFAVFSNVLKIDQNGKPVNLDESRHRTAQYIRMEIDRDYSVTPPFQPWETTLHL
jgi:hypothetical protein